MANSNNIYSQPAHHEKYNIHSNNSFQKQSTTEKEFNQSEQEVSGFKEVDNQIKSIELTKLNKNDQN